MVDSLLHTPVAFLIFNRPETTAQVFEAIRAARPPKLLIVADGPRQNRPGEAELCAEVRAIASDVDWPCEVLTNYSDVNMGCKARISSGLDWVFSQVEEAIILEDDCLPTESFFGFCEMMLDRYRDNERVMMIAGTNFLLDEAGRENSCYFSNMVSIWGWATWRTSWQKRITDFGVINTTLIAARFNSRTYSKYIVKMLRGAISGSIDTWDVQWFYSVILNNAICVTPLMNQVKNIGYLGTHTSGTSSPFFDMETKNFDLSRLKYPDSLTISSEFDSTAMNNIIKYNRIPRNLFELVLNKIAKTFRIMKSNFSR